MEKSKKTLGRAEIALKVLDITLRLAALVLGILGLIAR